jgi:sugar (pentulose or hexulose) kinase
VSIRRTHVPNPAVKSLYDKAYRTYRQLYDNTKNLMKEAAHESGGIT